MSELKKTRDVSTYQKLPPPRSLQGEDDAEVTWDLILKRYPNAAPLLCQMENVIERAEGLLHQLRSPCHRVPEKSSSLEIADLEDELMGPCHAEESTEVSMTSEEDSRLPSVENMTPEIVSVAGCSLSVEEEVRSIDAGRREISKTEYVDDASSSSIRESDSKSLSSPELGIQTNLGAEESAKSLVSSILNIAGSPTSSKNLLEEVGKSSSLEAWGKVVGENVSQSGNFAVIESAEDSSGVVDAEDSVSEHARRLSVFKTGPIHQITKLNLLGKKEELTQRFSPTIITVSEVVDAVRTGEKNDGLREAEPVAEDDTGGFKDRNEIESLERKMNELGERMTNSSGNVVGNVEESGVKNGVLSESLEKNKEKLERNEVQGNGDEALATPGVGPRSAVEILQEYSKICGVPVEYKNLSPSCSYNKSVIVKCCFGGFAFDACAQARKTAKKDAAAKLLRCLAGRQIDGENIAELTPFTRKQIQEIINLGNGAERETAVRKLYKICMELNAPEPVYTVHQDSGIVGNRYTAKCGALGITTSGYGIRAFVAKRVAADKLLRDYHENKIPAH